MHTPKESATAFRVRWSPQQAGRAIRATYELQLPPVTNSRYSSACVLSCASAMRRTSTCRSSLLYSWSDSARNCSKPRGFSLLVDLFLYRVWVLSYWVCFFRTSWPTGRGRVCCKQISWESGYGSAVSKLDSGNSGAVHAEQMTDGRTALYIDDQRPWDAAELHPARCYWHGTAPRR